MDRIDALRVFVSVVNEGSFTRAADHLKLSPQLVSKYIAQLEARLGVRLLSRTTRRVSPTEAGVNCYQHATGILSRVDDMENHLGDLQQHTRGTLRINAPVSFAIRHLSVLLTEFQNHYSGVSIDLQLSDRKVDIVEEGFDLALRIGQLKSSTLIAKPIAPINLVLCASPGYLATQGTPSSPEDLINHRYLGYSYMEKNPSDELYANLLSNGKADHGGFQSNNGDLLVEAAIADGGIVLQPTFLVSQALATGKLQRILSKYPITPLNLYVVYPHRKLLTAKVRCFLQFIDGYFGDPPYWDEPILAQLG